MRARFQLVRVIEDRDKLRARTTGKATDLRENARTASLLVGETQVQPRLQKLTVSYKTVNNF